MTTAITEQKALSLKNACVQFMFAYQQRNVDKMLSFCNPDGEVHFVPLGSDGRGTIGQLGKTIWTAIIESFPDIDNTLDAAVAEDNNTIRCQVVIRGTQSKDFAGIINQGKHFESDHIFIFQLDDNNMINSIQIEWPHEDFVRQLTSIH